MIEITVCIGSSCHTKGAYLVVERFQEIIREQGLEDRILLKGSFCLGKCASGTTVRVGDNYFTSVESKDVDKLISEILNGSIGGQG